MKLGGVFLALLLLTGSSPAVAAVVGAAAHSGHSSAHGTSASATLRASEAASGCTVLAGRFMYGPTAKETIIEQALSFCATDKKLDEAGGLCFHFMTAVEGALRRHAPGTELTPKAFCEDAEEYMFELRNAPRVAHLSPPGQITCEDSVSKAIAPHSAVTSKRVPDFWYAMCMNQDCAHFLPSRTRWCNVNHAPVLSATVCDDARIFIGKKVKAQVAAEMGATQVCSLYKDFVKEMALEVNAWERVTSRAVSAPIRSGAPQSVGGASLLGASLAVTITTLLSA
mmetsp:Transcript_76042/g.163221  ORF Transcript_76042/g.163221 Transcript_76042/m.163221 type:complete len:283 (-) Transcript_76042:95-943(-)